MDKQNIGFSLLTITFTLFMLLPATIFSSPTISNLKKKLEKKTLVGPDKVDVLNQLAILHCEADPALGKRYSSEALNLAEPLSYAKGIADAKHTLAYIFWQERQTEEALTYFGQALLLSQHLEAYVVPKATCCLNLDHSPELKKYENLIFLIDYYEKQCNWDKVMQLQKEMNELKIKISQPLHAPQSSSEQLTENMGGPSAEESYPYLFLIACTIILCAIAYMYHTFQVKKRQQTLENRQGDLQQSNRAENLRKYVKENVDDIS